MQQCFWCHGIKNNKGSNPFCTNRCQIDLMKYERNINKLRKILLARQFRTDPQTGIKSHETITDRIWSEIVA